MGTSLNFMRDTSHKKSFGLRVRSGIRRWATSPVGDRLGKLPGVPQLRPKIRRFIARHFHPEIVDVQGGHRMYLDARDTLLLSWYGYYEPDVTDLFKAYIKPGQTVFDIGANIGYYTLLAAKWVGPSGRVVAFEPEPSNFEILRKNVQLNGYSHVTLVPHAVSKAAGKIRLYLNEQNRGDHRIYDSGETRTSIEIETVSLDGYCAEHPGRVDFIKMDIQGAEGGALDGMKNVLQQNPSVVAVSEFWPEGLRRFGTLPESYLEQWRGLGFKLYPVSASTPLEPLQDIPRYVRWVSQKDDSNLLCVRDPA